MTVLDYDYRLEDKYLRASGRVFLTGIEALVRLPMLQQQRDRSAGRNTAGFISGYRGSPLGGYDSALWKARKQLADNGVVFQPGLNEELAATAVWGSQQLDLYPAEAKVAGVNAIWYGKSPGVDRAMDALKHGALAGSSKSGGVLVVAGDDHACQSSSAASHSDFNFVTAGIPTLQPTGAQDIIDYGLWAFELSRFSGLWVGFKLAVDTVESGGSVDVSPDRIHTMVPPDFVLPEGGLNIRWPDPFLEQERRLFGPKMDALAAFARTNSIDKVVLDSPRPRLGIVAAGKSYLDVRQALADLGIGEAQASELGIRVYKLGLSWPLEARGALRFAAGLEEILVVEEKRGLIEEQLASLLYRIEGPRPRIVGKKDEAGQALIPPFGEVNSAFVGRVICERLQFLNVDVRPFAQRLPAAQLLAKPDVVRQAYFCSGCPHNTSTKLPDGSRGMAGIGCHGMVMWMPERNTGPVSQMGGEGLHWVGQAPFSSRAHVFQNLGDGTYSHSGLLAIRAAAAAGVNITYKILYNDAVAMTGGQPVEGHLTVPQITHQVKAQGARKTVIVTDDVGRYAGVSGLAPGVTVRPREELDVVQRELSQTPGLTILIYDQTCAAEKRRRRKGGSFPDPDRRIFINKLVCEGCGDCQAASNCISVQAVETPFGLKRQIDQSSCNKDYSCVEGFCPSFVSVKGARVRKSKVATDDPAEGLPAPAARLDEPCSILITGIGGTGVITVGHIIGMAAHLEGRGVSVLDNTGMAQKNGAVMSHVRLAPKPADLFGVRVAQGRADLLLGCDMVTAVSPNAMASLAEGVTWAVVNDDVAPVAAGLTRPDYRINVAAMRNKLRRAVGRENLHLVPATRIATQLMGDSIAANMFTLGYAFQSGRLPLSYEAIKRAIELNGVAIEANLRAFAWGRLAAHDLDRVTTAARMETESAEAESLESVVGRRVAFLEDYQNSAYGEAYRQFVEQVHAAEQRIGATDFALTEAVARSLFKLMAYKDEYEVARLYRSQEFREALKAQFEGDYKISFHLAPPILAKHDRFTGKPVKRTFGGWMQGAFALLAPLKVLRGTPFDIFGMTAERRQERRDIEDFKLLVGRLIEGLSPANRDVAVKLAASVMQIRGYGHVKDANRARVLQEQAELLATFDSAHAKAA
ncbi:MAG TPA: indolepyruvate ferredoxin oxidoreductase family protein [Phenylobacterium sp.]|uniref:indolepyruvate ferredoxin oxidoreductase family protein n=1 Tax=Phenylobacterium sp. TaxID=1871053 RepID=UPI002B4711F5|nr:indolepyruvate ferredoxin oxidoreductase family protein [Phenylobacterium sp.]HKR88013.1 indolepyruvate ferredoxin oxidoreductase family protein [Phenylobacterium sp.]